MKGQPSCLIKLGLQNCFGCTELLCRVTPDVLDCQQVDFLYKIYCGVVPVYMFRLTPYAKKDMLISDL